MGIYRARHEGRACREDGHPGPLRISRPRSDVQQQGSLQGFLITASMSHARHEVRTSGTLDAAYRKRTRGDLRRAPGAVDDRLENWLHSNSANLSQSS